jgi:hypothetical protein
MNRFDFFFFRLFVLAMISEFLRSLLNEVDVDGINSDDWGCSDAREGSVLGFVLLHVLFCIKMCTYTKRLIVAPVTIAYPQLLPNNDSMLNLLFTIVSKIPDPMATDAMTFINIRTLGNKIEKLPSLLAGNSMTNIKNIIPHHAIEEKKWIYRITTVVKPSRIMAITIGILMAKQTLNNFLSP